MKVNTKRGLIMYHNLAIRLTTYFISQSEKNDVNDEVVVYGLELLFGSIVNFIILLFIGMIFHKIPETICFLVFFCPIRQYTGGYHAPNSSLCTLIFSVYYIVLIALNITFSLEIQWIILILSNVTILSLAPVEDHNKPLGQLRKQKVLKRVRFLLFLENVIYIVSSVLMGNKWWNSYIVQAVLTISILLLLGILKNKKIRSEELC